MKRIGMVPKSISCFTTIGMTVAIAAVSVSASIVTVPMVPGSSELGSSDSFTYTAVGGDEWNVTIPLNSPLHYAILVPTINGSPLQANLYNAPTVVLRDLAPNPHLHSAVMGVIEYGGDYVFSFIFDYNTTGFWVPGEFLPYVGPIVSYASWSPISAPNWYLADGTGQFSVVATPEPATWLVGLSTLTLMGLFLIKKSPMKACNS